MDIQMSMKTSLEHDHSPEAIDQRLSLGNRPNYLRDWVYGGIDGTVTTFAVVAGVAGASLPSGILLILGLANLVADGFSMAASNYSGTKTEIDDYARLRERELRHIRLDPQGEQEEVRQIFARKGLSGPTLDATVTAISANEETWVELMMTEEYGLATTQRDPVKSALSTFIAFIICGFVPLLPFLLPFSSPFLWSTLMTSAVFVAIGSAKSRWALVSWWRSGLETLIIGTAAAGAAYIIGYALRELAGVAM